MMFNLSTPFVSDRNNSYDIYSRLLKDRIVFIIGEIDDYLANSVIAQLLYLSSEDIDKPISIYINSPGGSVSAGLAIYDTMSFIKPNVSTLCFGIAASMGAFLLSSGKKGKRYSLVNSRIMIHQPIGCFKGQVSDIKIHAREILRLKNKINIILSKNTRKSIKRIEKDTDRDFFMSARKAVKYGLIDKIIKG